MNMIDKDAVLHMIDINIEPHAHGEWDSGYNVALSEMREKIKQLPTMADIGFADIEVLQAKNTKVLAINGTRVSREKGYGMMSVIAKFEIPVSDIREIIDNAMMGGDSE